MNPRHVPAAAIPDLVATLQATLPLLIRLGDYIGNGENRCDVILSVRGALATLNSNRRPVMGEALREPAPAVDTSRLSDAELFRQFKRTAPIEDLRFFLRHARLSPALRADGDALLAASCRNTGGTLSRSDWYRRLTALQDRWRRETADASNQMTADAVRGVA